jgi:hypothetical protein
MMIKKFNEFSQSRFSVEDIIEAIKNGDWIRVKNIKNFPEHNEEDLVEPINVDNDGLVTVSTENGDYEVDLDNIIEINRQ